VVLVTLLGSSFDFATIVPAISCCPRGMQRHWRLALGTDTPYTPAEYFGRRLSWKHGAYGCSGKSVNVW
jgi:hypothetical protein